VIDAPELVLAQRFAQRLDKPLVGSPMLRGAERHAYEVQACTQSFWEWAQRAYARCPLKWS